MEGKFVVIYYKGRGNLNPIPVGLAVVLNEGIEVSAVQSIAERISVRVANFGGDPINELVEALADMGSVVHFDAVTVWS